MASIPPPPDYDPWTQPISLLLSDGSTYNTSMQAVDGLRIYGAKVAITYGSQIGATLILLLVLLLLTRAEKRKSSIFLVNAFCLITNAIRCVLLSCYVTSSLFDPFAQITGDFSRVTKSDMATSIAANVFTLIVTILILISLSTQVWVVCITTPPFQRYIIMGTTSIVALVAVAYKAAFVILNIMQTLDYRNLEPFKYVVLHSYITQAVSIGYFSVVFTYKLGYAIIQRRKLNMPQFGPMQIVFIMGCQTMLVPAIITCLQFRNDMVELGIITPTVICVFLPLSAIWAGIINAKAVAYDGPDSHHRLIQDAFFRSASNSTYGSNSATMMDRSLQMSVCTCATKCQGTGSAAMTPSARKKSLSEYDEDTILVGREFGFTRHDVGDRV